VYFIYEKKYINPNELIMKKNNLFVILLLSFLSLVLGGCDKDEIKSSEMAILSFSFNQLDPMVNGSINDNTISIVVPYGTDVTNLEPSIGISAKASIAPKVGVKRDFSSPVNYTVTAEDGQIQNYEVKVEVIKNTEREILTFLFNELDPVVEAVINENTVYAEVIYGTDVTTMVPTVEISSDATISPEIGIATDFSNTVNYTVTAQDAQTESYEVNVKILENTESIITSFVIDEQYRETIIDEENHQISIKAEKGVDITSLLPSIEISEEATIIPALDEPQDFSSPVEYTVTAQNQNYQRTYTISIELPIDFVDPNLEQAVRDAMRYSGEAEGYIYPSEVSKITKLEAIDKSISDLAGIGNLVKLNHLDLGRNTISSITPLSELIGIEVLWLGNNEIQDITILNDFTTLKNLDVGGNKITDISALTNLIDLEYLNICINPIEMFPSFEKLQKLEHLNIAFVRTDQVYNNGYEFLRGLTNLRILGLAYTGGKVLTGLESLSSLKELSLDATNCSDLSLLENLTQLEWLNLSGATILTQENIDALQLKLPNTTIVFD